MAFFTRKILLLAMLPLWSIADTLRIATMDLPPYGWVSDRGQNQGVLYEFNQEIGVRSGMPFVHVVLPFSRMLQLLREGRIDLLSSQPHAEALRAGDSLAVQYVNTVVIISSQGFPVSKLEEFRGKTVVYHLSASYPGFDSLPQKIARVNHYSQAIDMLRAKRVDGIVISEPAFYYWIAKRGYSVEDFGSILVLDSTRKQLAFVRRGLPLSTKLRLREIVDSMYSEHRWDTLLIKNHLK